MERTNKLEADEKIEVAAATAPGGLIEETSDEKQQHAQKEHRDAWNEKDERSVEVEPHDHSSRSRSPSFGDSDPNRDGGELEAAQSGPPYSIFSKKKKIFIIFMSALAGFFSPLSANIYFPALNPIAADLGVSNSAITLTLTTYMIFQGLAPTVMGDLSDMSGRRPVYIIGFVVYIGACIGIALQDSFAALLILRCVQSSGSSSFVALGAGVAADVSTSAERGSYIGWTTSGMLLGPAIGPVIGGLLSQFLGWRSIFWFLVIIAGVFLVPFLIFFPETGRNVVGNGSIPPQTYNMSLLNWLATRKAAKEAHALHQTASLHSVKSSRDELAKQRKLKWPNPFKTLRVVFEKDIGLLLLYNSLVYTAFYDVTASQSYLFKKIYGFDDLQIGLTFIPFGVGCFLAPLINGRALDWRFRKVAAAAGITVDKKRGNSMRDFPLEKARVPVALPLVLVGDACLLAYGWVMQAGTNLAVPLILQFIMGVTLTGSFNVMSVMLVDNYPNSPATATAANNLVRCLMGAGGTAIIIYMIEGMGRGWCFTFIAGVVLLTTPILLVLMRYGPQWRQARMEKLDEKAARTAA